MKRKKMFLWVYIELTNIHTWNLAYFFYKCYIKKKGGGGHDDVILRFSGRKKESVNIYIVERKSEQSSGIRIPPHLKQIFFLSSNFTLLLAG